MWNCEKECGYWDKGCTIEYNPETLLILCPCYEMVITQVNTHARDPTPRATPSRSGVKDQSQRAAQVGAVKGKEKVP